MGKVVCIASSLRKFKNPALCGVLNFRRGRDSNSRYGFPYAVFPGLCLKPLGHLSKISVRYNQQLIYYSKLRRNRKIYRRKERTSKRKSRPSSISGHKINTLNKITAAVAKNPTANTNIPLSSPPVSPCGRA